MKSNGCRGESGGSGQMLRCAAMGTDRMEGAAGQEAERMGELGSRKGRACAESGGDRCASRRGGSGAGAKGGQTKGGGLDRVLGWMNG